MKGPKACFNASECRKWHLHFQNFLWGGGGCFRSPLASSLATLGRSARSKISHLSIFKIWQHWESHPLCRLKNPTVIQIGLLVGFQARRIIMFWYVTIETCMHSNLVGLHAFISSSSTSLLWVYELQWLW